eukprot:1393974-Amphidinium_carterae.1
MDVNSIRTNERESVESSNLALLILQLKAAHKSVMRAAKNKGGKGGKGKGKGDQKGKQQKPGSGNGKSGPGRLQRPRVDLEPTRMLRRGGGGANAVNKGKGKGQAVGAVEGETEPASAGSTDIGAASDPSRFGGWTRLNFDSGCGKTVLP